MYLKRIELEGFKSFADRTVISVERGLTGVVGPNGCGKSNVVDAILWVMGERSAKSLRADAMGDVIFKGAEGRAAAPYAMVEVILGDEEGVHAGPGGEISVGRRLFQTGESEFLLHGRKVRRKDVQDLLMDTGLGVQGYMVLAQGKIDAVLAANPAERRSVFEEAAGISRYKARKAETSRKLDHAAQDLARVEDVLSEVQRQVRSLKYQAGRARSWLKMRDRLKELRVRVGLAETAHLAERETEIEKLSAEVDAQVKARKDERLAADARLTDLVAREDSARQSFERVRGKAAASSERLAGLEERLRGLEHRKAECEEGQGSNQVALDQLVDLEESFAGETRALLKEKEGLEIDKESSQADLTLIEGQFLASQTKRREERQDLEKLRSRVLEALGERTRHNNRMAVAAKERSEAEGGLEARQRRRQEIESEAVDIENSVAAATQSEGEASRAAGVLEEKVQSLSTARDKLRASRSDLDIGIEKIRREEAAYRARAEALQEIGDEGGELPSPVRRALNDSVGESSLLLEGVVVPPPWDKLLASLLGRLQHAVWVDNRPGAMDTDGTVDFLFPGPGTNASQAVAGLTPLRVHLSGDREKCDALCRRLGPVFTTAEGASAAALAEKHPGFLFLSEDGELHGAGSARLGMLKEEETGLLARRGARKKAESSRSRAAAELSALEAQSLEISKRLAQVEEDFGPLESEYVEARGLAELAGSRKEEESARQGRRQEEVSALRTEEEHLLEVMGAASQQELEAEAARDQAEAARLAAANELEKFESASGREDEEHAELSEKLQNSRVQQEGLERGMEVLEEREQSLQSRKATLEADRGRLREESEGLIARASRLDSEIQAARIEQKNLEEGGDGAANQIRIAEENLEEATRALAEERNSRSDDSGQVEELLGKRQEYALEMQEARMRREELFRGVEEDYGEPLVALAKELEVDVSSPLSAETTLVDLKEEMDSTRSRMDSAGPVNLEAVQELEEKTERVEFLLSEKEDLEEGRRNLEETLEDLDRLCREKFLETFETVSGRFEQIFRRLFRGGKAEINLTPEEDPLEAGIEITARPPGKKLQTLQLLSGGERTLTALALLLAVFRSRPSPFCLLDEVDAALDDSNVERFIEALSDFTHDTQFVVVTHNRITMSHCERLFGVTMRRKGVSLLVGVELSEIPEGADSRSDRGVPSGPGGDRYQPEEPEIPAVEASGEG
ncbi:MAG TPA: chromosome segregation protein SMC [Planctomycetes bacterium]|nr:chromosome segregation protein SMC [Planctomycetota bacterium]